MPSFGLVIFLPLEWIWYLVCLSLGCRTSLLTWSCLVGIWYLIERRAWKVPRSIEGVMCIYKAKDNHFTPVYLFISFPSPDRCEGPVYTSGYRVPLDAQLIAALDPWTGPGQESISSFRPRRQLRNQSNSITSHPACSAHLICNLRNELLVVPLLYYVL